MPDLHNQMLRIASELPKGDPTRRKLLSALTKQGSGVRIKNSVVAKTSVQIQGPQFEGSERSGVLTGWLEAGPRDESVKFEADVYRNSQDHWEVGSVKVQGSVEELVTGLIHEVFLEDDNFPA